MSKDKYGFVYIWMDKKQKRFYIGCHWGFENDGYICSSPWMMQAYRIRPRDFKRRILQTNITTRQATFNEELRWLQMIKPSELTSANKTKKLRKNVRYYNLNNTNNKVWHSYDKNIKKIGQKISLAKLGKKPNITAERLAERGKRISESKQRKAEQRFIETGSRLTEAQQIADRSFNIGRKHTKKWKNENSERLKYFHQTIRKKIAICPHCQFEGNEIAMKRWHFDNCRSINITI